MDCLQQIQKLNEMLLQDLPQYRGWAGQFAPDADSQRRLLRSLMNLRPPHPLTRDFLALQDALLTAERDQKGIVDGMALPVTARCPQIALWRGDITRLGVDAIVNAANAALLGCFCPCHGCIDNAIHSAAGLQLRTACAALMRAQGHEEAVGGAKLTAGYDLPARWVLHTVGPIIDGAPTPQQRRQLADCYTNCLRLAAAQGLQSVAFCCISTGEFHFPHQEAAEIAVQTVKAFLGQTTSIRRVIFNVFTELDETIYRHLLGPDQATAAGAD